MGQRLIIAVTVALGGLVFVWVEPALSAGDGSTGISLMSARVGLVAAVLLALMAAVPAVVMGSVASASGNPLGGIFAAAAALAVMAGVGGSSEGWLGMQADRPDALPGVYGGLIIETLLWHAPLVGLMFAVAKGRHPLRQRWPQLAMINGDDTIDWAAPTLHAIYAGLACAAVAAVMGMFLLRSADTAQIMIGLIVAFTLGGLVGTLFFPQSNPICLLLSPALVAIVAYAYVVLRFDSPQQVLSAWWTQSLSITQRLPGPAVALPVHFASAGVIGVTLGIGWAQTIVSNSHQSGDQ